jgi:paraquat-inducible protein A
MNDKLQKSKPFLISCHECDLLHKIGSPLSIGTAHCSRCGAVLHRHKKNSVDRAMALAVTGVILFVIANLYPFLGFRMSGQIRHSNLVTGIIELYSQGMWMLATLVLTTTILVPALQLAGMVYVLLPFFLNLTLPKRIAIYRMIKHFQPWGMTEVFSLGILVAIVKLSKMATIIPGTALYAFMALMFVLAGIPVVTDPFVIWGHWEKYP